MINFVGIKEKIRENIKESIDAYLVTIATAINFEQWMSDFISDTSAPEFSLHFGCLKS